MVKKLFKRKTRKKSKKQVLVDLRKEYLAKAQELETRLSTSGDAESLLTELSELFRDFLKEFFHIKYQPTNEEIVAELEKKKLRGGVGDEVVRFLQELTMLRYSPTRSITTQTVKKKIGIFLVLVDTIYEATSKTRSAREKKGKGIIAAPKEVFKNFAAGIHIVGKWSRHGWQLASQRLSRLGFQGARDGTEYVMEQLAKGYDALEDNNVRQAEKCLERIQDKLESFTLDDQKAVEGEITAFKKELSLYVEKPEPKVPLSSVPDGAKGRKRRELPSEEELDAEELERFVRLALDQNVPPALIRKRLLKKGWPAPQIDKIFRSFSVSVKAGEQEKEKGEAGAEDADELELFVRQALDNNIPLPLIREQLLKRGWPNRKVDSVIRKFSK